MRDPDAMTANEIRAELAILEVQRREAQDEHDVAASEVALFNTRNKLAEIVDRIDRLQSELDQR
jgi:hypothetical protein